MIFKLILIIITLLQISCGSKIVDDRNNSTSDPYLWLEDIEGKKSMDWVNQQNERTATFFSHLKNFNTSKAKALTILESKDKIPYGEMANGYIYNFWQDEKNTRGIWRRTTVSEYKKNKPNWNVLLDIDQLSKQENENWVFKGSVCHKPSYKVCLLKLSRGGKDAIVTREYNLDQKKFVVDQPFILPEAKSEVAWVDTDKILVATDFGKDSMTDSGYPREIKLWQRGSALETASSVLKVSKSDMAALPYTFQSQTGSISVVINNKDFYTQNIYILDNQKLLKLHTPETADLVGYINEHLIFLIKKDWSVDGVTFKAGSVLAINKNLASQNIKGTDIINLFTPNDSSTILSVALIKDGLVLNVIENVLGKLLTISIENNRFSKSSSIETPPGHVLLDAADSSSSEFFFKIQSYLAPDSLYSFNQSSIKKIKSLPKKFSSQGMSMTQRWVASKDGTKVPYFLIGKSDVIKKGNAPTLLYGYGGFEVSVTPNYNGVLGKLWLEKGGLYAVANIRGGGEFGPKWHQAALKTNRQKAYDDFISVAEDLIQSKITSSSRLGIQGGSNGGLLVSAVMTQRPELFGSVICQVPLIDMLRYSQLLAGASWMAEYGDPADSEMRNYILTYSPYQKVDEQKKYPPILFITSTKDDRVHPGHARKMMAKLSNINSNAYYYENTEGGHAASANFKQRAHVQGMIYNFLEGNLYKK